MPRLEHIPPKLRKHVRGQAFVRVNGKDRYLGPHGSLKAKYAYQEFVTEWTLQQAAEARAAQPPVPEEPSTVGELCVAYQASREGKADNNTYALRSALAIVAEMFGVIPAEEFSPKKLKAVREAMIAKDWTRRYINEQVYRVKKTFDWAVSEELIHVTIADALQRTKKRLSAAMPAKGRKSNPCRSMLLTPPWCILARLSLTWSACKSSAADALRTSATYGRATSQSMARSRPGCFVPPTTRTTGEKSTAPCSSVHRRKRSCGSILMATRGVLLLARGGGATAACKGDHGAEDQEGIRQRAWRQQKRESGTDAWRSVRHQRLSHGHPTSGQEGGRREVVTESTASLDGYRSSQEVWFAWCVRVFGSR